MKKCLSQTMLPAMLCAPPIQHTNKTNNSPHPPNTNIGASPTEALLQSITLQQEATFPYLTGSNATKRESFNQSDHYVPSQDRLRRQHAKEMCANDIL